LAKQSEIVPAEHGLNNIMRAKHQIAQMNKKKVHPPNHFLDMDYIIKNSIIKLFIKITLLYFIMTMLRVG